MVCIALGAGCSDQAPTSTVGLGNWGSNDASLAVSDSGATLEILASGGCYGSYGSIDAPIPTGSFTVAGTYTQLIGAFPGKLQYAAQFAGALTGRQMSITIAVPDLQRSFGPYVLTYGVKKTWSACLYP